MKDYTDQPVNGTMEKTILNRNETSYWIGFFMCLFILGVSFEIINQFEKQLTIEIMHKFYNSLLVWSPIFMIGISLFGMFIVIYLGNKKKIKEN